MSDQARVALVNMPFSYSKYPSIQLGTLSALLKSKGVPVDCHHLNVRFAHKIGVPLYEMNCEKRALFGEWLFSYLLFRDNPKRAEYPRVFKPVFEQVARESGHPISFFEEMATRTAPQFLTWEMTAIDWGQCLPQWGHFTSALPSGGWATDAEPCTRVAGTPPADAAAAPTVEADIGFPQSMQNRDPSSLVRPQWAHLITGRIAPAEFAQRG